jgi:hypothetical protein
MRWAFGTRCHDAHQLFPSATLPPTLEQETKLTSTAGSFRSQLLIGSLRSKLECDLFSKYFNRFGPLDGAGLALDSAAMMKFRYNRYKYLVGRQMQPNLNEISMSEIPTSKILESHTVEMT